MLLKKQEWEVIDTQKDVAICEFAYKAGSWKKTMILKAIHTVKEYVETDFFGENKIVPVYQYACYISTYELDAAGLHKIYKQRSTSEFCDEIDQSKLVLNWRVKKQNLQSETWIEQVKSHVMAGATLTGDFWANDILWQLSILAYNISVMMRQKKDKFNRQEHRTFIEWFIAVPAKITRSGHQTKIRCMKIIFTKPIGKSLIGWSKRHKKQRRRKIWNQPQECMGEVHSFNSKKENQEAFYALRTKDTKSMK